MTELEKKICEAIMPSSEHDKLGTMKFEPGLGMFSNEEVAISGNTRGMVYRLAKLYNEEAPAYREQQTGHCRHCGSKIQQSHKEILSKSKLDLLQMAAKHVIESGVKEFQKKDVGDFAENPSNYNNFQKLRYHGLIAQSGLRSQWVITRNAWAFLRGDKELPKFVLVRNNHIVDRSPELISAKDVWKGSPEVITYFEYYDDDGNYVGVRPNTVSMVNQAGLF